MSITKTNMFICVIGNILFKFVSMYFLMYAMFFFLIKRKHFAAGDLILTFISFIYIIIFIYVYLKGYKLVKQISRQEKLSGHNFKNDMRGNKTFLLEDGFISSQYWFLFWEGWSFYAFCKENIKEISSIMMERNKFYVKVTTKDGKEQIILTQKRFDNLQQLLVWYENI